MNLLPSAIAAEAAVVVIHCRPWRKVVRQHPPGAAGSHQIQNAIDHLPHVCCSWPPAGFSWWQQKFEQLPLFVCQITGVYLGIHTSVIGQKPTFRTLSKASREYDIRLSHNGKRVQHPQIHWLVSGWTFEVWDIKEGGKYKLTVGSKSIQIDCKQQDIIRGLKEAQYRKTGATADRAKFSKQVIAPDKSISVRVFAGRHAGRFHVTIEPKA